MGGQHADVERFITVEHEIDLAQGLSETGGGASILAIVDGGQIGQLRISRAGDVRGEGIKVELIGGDEML